MDTTTASRRGHEPFLSVSDLAEGARGGAHADGRRPTVDDLAVAVAAGQHGLATRAQLRAVGVNARTIHRRLATARWSEPTPSLIDLNTHVDSWARGLSGALLVGGPGRAWASHHTAAHLHGFLDVPRPDVHDVLLPRGTRRQRSGVAYRTSRRVPHDDRTRVDGFPVTSVARTFVDLATLRADDALEPILWELVRGDPQLSERIAWCAAGHPDPAVRRVVTRLLGGVHPQIALAGSPLEIGGLLGLRNEGLPRPVLQYTIRDGRGRFVRRVDAAWPTARLAVEFDGAAYHRTPRQLAADRRQREALAALGWRVVVIRAGDLHGQRIEQLAAEIHAHLADHGVR